MKLAYAIKFVADMDRAVAFHRDVLGLMLKFQSPGWSEFLTGETTLALALQGYVFVLGNDSTATLTVTVNGATTTRSYHAETDRTFTERLDVPLRGVHSCRITIKVALEGAAGYLNTAVIDGELG